MRTVGLPALAVVAAFLLARRVPWRVLGAAVLVCALPIVAYAGWFAADEGRFALGGSTGVFLYSRTLSFADCARIRPPESERALCPRHPRDPSTVWADDSPLTRLPGSHIDAAKDRLAGDFAVRAIKAQPLDYLRVVAKDVARAFRPGHPEYPDRQTYRYYLFRPYPIAPPERTRTSTRASTSRRGSCSRTPPPWRATSGTCGCRGPSSGWSCSPARRGMATRYRRLGGRASLPWGLAAALLVIPPATTGFDYRYVLPACTAAALALRQRPNNTIRTPRTLDVPAYAGDRE